MASRNPQGSWDSNAFTYDGQATARFSAPGSSFGDQGKSGTGPYARVAAEHVLLTGERVDVVVIDVLQINLAHLSRRRMSSFPFLQLSIGCRSYS